MTDASAAAANRVLRGGRAYAGLGLRVAGLLYDVMMVTALLLIGTLLFLPATGGEAPAPGSWAAHALQAYLLALVYLFFAVFWTRDGRTVGMMAWRLRIVDERGLSPSLRQASLRFAAAALSWALLGLGFAWALVDGERRALHDRLAGTWLIREPRDG
mgnify:CR=1 FL=1